MTFTCEYCGGVFHRKPYQARRFPPRFCSRSCQGKVNGKKHADRLNAVRPTGPLPLEQRLKIAESNRRTKAAPPDEVRSCSVCGKSFTCRPHSTQHLCSTDCRQVMVRPRRSAESRARMSERYQAQGNPAWKGGHSPRDRNARPYRLWRYVIYRRDRFTCQDCGVRGSRSTPIQAHHIEPWAKSPSKRYLIENGVTLCRPCHQERHRLLRQAA